MCSRNFWYVVLIGLLFLSLYSIWGQKITKPNEIPISQVVEQVQKGEIEKISVEGNKLTLTKKDGKKEIAYKEAEAKLTDYGITSDKVKIEVKGEGRSALLMGILYSFLPVILIIAFFYWMMRQAATGGRQALSFGETKARLFGPGKTKVTFSDVAGLKEAKQELMEVVEFLKNPGKFRELGAEIPRGVLLTGPAGTGKTLLAKAVAGQANVPFFSMSASELVEMFVGVGAARTRSSFQKAKRNAPSILFLDELDAIGRVRGAGIGGGHDEREQTLNQILVEMDGFETDTRVVVLAASVTGETPILVKEPNREVRLIPIGNFVDRYYQSNEGGIEKPISNIEVLGFERKIPRSKILKNNLYFGHSAFKPIRSVFRHKVNEIYEIKYLGGKIKTTGNHSVFVRTNQGIKPKRVDELKKGDCLVDLPFIVCRTNRKRRQERAHLFPKDFNLSLKVYQEDEELLSKYQFAIANKGILSQTQIAQMVGVTQGAISDWHHDGRVMRAISRNYFKHQLPEYVKVTPRLCRLLGYYTAEGYSRKELDFCLGTHEEKIIEDIKILMEKLFGIKPDKIHFRGSAINIVYYSKPLAQFFAKYCGKGAFNKHLPSFLFEAPKEYFLEFLRGYFRGDGYYDRRKRGAMVSVSKQLILELQWLCRMHGIKTFIDEFEAKKGRRINNGKPLSATKAFIIGFGKRMDPFVKQTKPMPARRAIVKNIKKIPYNGFVYDLCGCENEAFFGGKNPILLHNTNRPDILDPALLRPGRFDRKIVLDLPDVKEREEILKIHTRGKPLEPNIDLERIAKITAGFSGADLRNLANEAAILAARRNKRKISQTELEESIEKVLLGPERKSHLLSEKEKKITAYHETGHAILTHLLPNCDPIHKISIISRGPAVGYTWSLPTEDRKLHSKAEFEDNLIALLGGRTAEELIFGDVTTGAQNDLKRTTKIAKDMVTQYGMSEKLGPITWGEREELVFLGKELGEQKTYSEETASKIDAEVRNIIEQASKKAKAILNKNKSILKKVAEKLIKEETIEGAEFEKLFPRKRKV